MGREEEMNSVIATGGGEHKLSCLLKNDLYKCALLGSFVLSLISFLGIPAVLRYGELHRDIWRALLAAGFVLTAVIAILFLAGLGYFAERQVRAGKISQRSFSLHLKRAGLYGCVFAAAALIYFFLCGVISSALYFFLGNLLFYSTIKLIIDLMTTVLSIAALPVFVLQLLAFSLSDLPFSRTIRAGLAAVKTGYWKVLLIILASAAAGLIFTAAFSLIGSAILQRILQIIVFTLLGSAGTYLVYKTGLGIFMKGAGR